MMKTPNFLLITADQLRWDTLGCAGNSVIQTPHLDRLAARGVRFTNAFTPDPICVPARAAIMTGNYPQICTGMKRNGGAIKPGQPLLTEVLKRAGYGCYAAGKLHFLPYAAPGEPRTLRGFEAADLHESGRILAGFDPEGKQRGLEDYFDYLSDVGWHGYGRGHGIGNNDVRPCAAAVPAGHYVDHWIAERTLARIRRHKEERAGDPFLMWMSSPKPHAPYDPPRPFDAMYDPREVPGPFGDAAMLGDRCPGIDMSRYSHGVAGLSPEAWRTVRAYYYGSISFLDRMIGKVLEALDAEGWLDDTVVLFAADHGDLAGDFGGCFKSCHLNGSVRVPMIAAGPGIRRGAVCESFVGLQDILPTLAGLAEAEIGQDVQGVDLRPCLARNGDSGRKAYYATTVNEAGFSTMLCTERWKYIYSEGNATEELYDLAGDPCELVNLAGDSAHDEARREMRARMEAEARRLGDDDIFEGGQLRSSPVDRAGFPKIMPTKIGWRFY